MRTVLRPLGFVLVSGASLAAFIAAGAATPDRADLADISGWLDRVDPVDALVEVARMAGIVLAAYVLVVSVLALVAELAGLARFARIQRLVGGMARAIALPSLRRRLLELGTAASLSAATIPSLAMAATATPVTQVAQVDVGPVSFALGAEFRGFDLPAEEARPEAAIHVVERGDTLWSIITAHYGRFDRVLLDSVLAVNPRIEDPNLILVGWQITLPALPGEPVVDPGAPVPMPRGESSWSAVTVQRGDTLWEIVDRNYGNATAERVWAVVDANPEIENPDLIYAGQVITLPPLGSAEVTEPGVDPPSDEEPASATPDSPPSTLPTPTSAPEAPPTEPVSDEAAPTGITPSMPVEPSAPTFTTSKTDESMTDDALEDLGPDDEAPGPSVAQPVGWTGGAALAAAILGLAARRRRRQPPRERTVRPSRRASQLGVALRLTDNLTTVEWASLALRELAARLRPTPGRTNAVPRLLRLAGEEIELMWDSPSPDLLEPWTSPDGGWSWTRGRPNDFDVRGTPHPCPALVTVGRHGGADVMLNLECCGALALVGCEGALDDFVQHVSLELGASPFADAPTVLVVSDAARVAGEPEHVRFATVDEAEAWLRDRADASSALVSSRRLTSLFGMRARAKPQDSHEPVVVIVDAASAGVEAVTRLVGLANGDLGAIVVIRGDDPSVTWRLRFGESTVTLEPLGLGLERVGLAAQTAELVEEIVPAGDPASDEEPAPTLELADAEAPLLLLPQLSEETNIDVDEEDFDVELKVLGQVRAVGTKQQLTPTELHLAIYLAFHRNGENADTISTMIWPDGARPKTLVNNMASLRRKLGTGIDGQMLFPLGRDNQYTYRLSDRVVTDWDRFVALARRAEAAEPDEALALLERAIDLIDGPPFRASAGYSWAYSEGIAASMVELAVRVGEAVLAGCLAGERIEAATRAGNGVLRIVDSPLDAERVVELTAVAHEIHGNHSHAAVLRDSLLAAQD